MAVTWSQWTVSAGLLWLGCLQVSLCVPPKADQVYVDRQLCPGTIDAGTLHGNWKRVLFSDAGNTCSGTYHCKLAFGVKNGSTSENSLCVDYTQMSLFGKNSSLELTSKNSDSKPVRLTHNRYPLIRRYMKTALCVSARDTLVLQFKTSCDKPLDESFQGWMYVYLLSNVTERIYFVEGNCSNDHRSFSARSTKVTLRSHVWNAADFDSPQYSKFRMSFYDHGQNRVCINWSYLLRPSFPEGVTVRMVKSFYNFDSVRKTLYVLGKSNFRSVDIGREKCYPMRMAETFILEVSWTANQTGNRASQNGLLLLEMIVTMEDAPWTPDKKVRYDTTTVYYTEISEDEDVDKRGSVPDPLKIGLCILGGVVSVLWYCCCRKMCRKPSSDEGSADGSEDDQNVGHRHSTVNRTLPNRTFDAGNGNGPSSYPMLRHFIPPLSQNHRGVNTRTSNDPPAYPADPPDYGVPDSMPPPAYESLFPDKNTEHA